MLGTPCMLGTPVGSAIRPLHRASPSSHGWYGLAPARSSLMEIGGNKENGRKMGVNRLSTEIETRVQEANRGASWTWNGREETASMAGNEPSSAAIDSTRWVWRWPCRRSEEQSEGRGTGEKGENGPEGGTRSPTWRCRAGTSSAPEASIWAQHSAEHTPISTKYRGSSSEQ